MEPETEYKAIFPQFSGLKTKTIYKVRMSEKKVYNKHIIIIVISNLFRRTVSRIVDVGIPSDHP